MIPVRALSTATLFAAILAGLSAHQATHGAIIGVVTDLSGAVLPGVTVVATKDAEQRTSTTDGSGRYRIDKLVPGPYQLEADRSGFLRQRVENVVVEAGREVAWSVSLPLPRDQSLPVESFIDPLTGAEARDCGRHTANPTIGNMRRSIGCALAASSAKVSFSTFQQYAGIDSRIAVGFLGRADGSIFYFTYDSQPCGGPGCPSRFTTQPCSLPTVREEESRVSFVCQ